MRNTLCPYYDKCLDKAIMENLAGWACDRCAHRNKHVSLLQETDLYGERLLLLAIFKPDNYKRYRKIESAKSTFRISEGGPALGGIMKKLLRLGEAAQLLNCSISTIRRLKDERKLEACMIRGGLRILTSSLEAYIRAEILNFQLENGEAEYPADEKEFQT